MLEQQSQPKPTPRDLPTLREIAFKAAQASGAVKVILFGSVARGEATDSSDLDLLMVIPDHVSWLEAGMKALDAIGRRTWSLDLVPMLNSEFVNGESALARVVAREGIVLYG